MINNEKYQTIVINKYSLGFDSVKTKENSPFVLVLQQNLGKIELPSNLLELETLIIDTTTATAYPWFRIFIGESKTLEEIDTSKRLVSYSEGLDYKDLLQMKPKDQWAFYKNEYENPVLLAKLNPLDKVVPNLEAAKEILINLSLSYQEISERFQQTFKELKAQSLTRKK